jgi:hypothetical protein
MKTRILILVGLILFWAGAARLLWHHKPKASSGALTFSWDAQPGVDVFKLYVTNMAASARFEDVRAVVRGATNGQVVYIPAGTAVWTQTLSPAPGVSVIGAGTNATFIIDEVPRNPNRPVISMSGTNYELSGITFKRGTTNTTVNYSGILSIAGSNFRIHDILFDNVAGIGGLIYSSLGLVDHVAANMPGQEVFQTLDSGYGDASWSKPSQAGTINALYFEDCYFPDNAYVPAIDAYCGSVLVVRHCIFTNSWLGNHGTDSSQRQRSCKWMEVYQNDFSFPTGTPNTPWPWVVYYRGGTGVVWSNRFKGRYTQGVKGATYRNIVDGSVDGSPNWKPWGPANGTNAWDGNQDTVSGWPCLDQVGRGAGDLISGNPPMQPAWPHQASEPLYVWGNAMAIDTSAEAGSQSLSVVIGRDIVVGTSKPGYVPFQYPHPLQSGITNTPPIPPTNTPPNYGLVATIPGNQTSFATNAAAGRGVFFLTSSNMWGESGPSNFATTPSSATPPTGFKITSN